MTAQSESVASFAPCLDSRGGPVLPEEETKEPRMTRPLDPSPPNDRPSSPDELQTLREDLDHTQREAREQRDSRRLTRQDVHDGSRQHGRGADQSRASLVRERREDSSELLGERGSEDRSRDLERSRTDTLISDLVASRDEAEERVVELTVGDDLRGRDLRQVLALVRSELGSIEDELRGVAGLAPPGELEALLAGSVGKIRACSTRIESALENVLDRDDSGSYHHDVGGSG